MSNALPFATTLEVRDACLCLHAQRAARTLARRFDRALRPAGLTNSQFSLMMALNRPAPPTMGAVATLLSIDRSTLTAALKPLERRGWIIRAADPDDGRGRLLALTDDGQATLAAAVPLWRAAQAAIEGALAPLDAATARTVLAALACMIPPGAAHVATSAS